MQQPRTSIQGTVKPAGAAKQTSNVVSSYDIWLWTSDSSTCREADLLLTGLHNE